MGKGLRTSRRDNDLDFIRSTFSVTADFGGCLRQRKCNGVESKFLTLLPRPVGTEIEIVGETAGEIKDEIVAESCGEVEDSEDDEWNYIKVEGGARPAVENQHSDLVSSEEGKEKNSMMNSPLNPDAAEFIPVSPVGVGEEYPETPVKNVPYELTDIVASSPNWATMENVALPEESEFLKEIKSRPSNLVDMSSNREENGDSFRNDVNEIDLTNSFDKSNVSDNIVYSPEPQGIALAKDMTGSFIDPATMSSRDGDGTEDKFGAVKSPLVEDIEPPFEEKKVTVSNEEPQFDQKPKMEYDFVSPPYVKEDVSPVSLMAATPKPTAFEALSSPESEASTLPIAEAPQTVTSDLQATVPATPFLAGEDAISPVPLNKSEDVEKVNETTLAAGVVAGAVAAAAATSAALLTSPTTPVKKDDKKPASKTGTPMKTTKTPTTKITETKTTTTLKRTSTPGQSARSPLTAKTTSTTPTSPTKTTVSRVSTVTKTAPKSPSQATTLSKAPTRPKTTPTPATSKAPVSRTSVTTTTVKSASVGPKPAARTTATTAATTLSAKPKPRVSSALTEKKTTVTMNGDAKTGVKRTETTTVTKRPGGTSTLTTRVTLSARPATAPARTAVSKTTVTTTTRTVTAKPRTTLGNTTTTTTTTTSTVTSAGRTSLGARKPGSLSTDKHTKEMANRLTSRTSTTATKMNGVAKLPGTGTTKTMRTTLTTKTTKVPGTPPKTKTVSKTEIKAEKILDNSIEIIQSEKETPPMENNKDINLINSIASE
ncbi:hypothetical protein RUM43_005773 [Polyplax serrata]|uniref:Uncharacterized protein n=1 Tax=Polyplax serrata TaxID=468196 RepID=A0AAN8PBP5_POLSC